MNGGMPGVGKWLRPPRSILIFFVLVVCVPAATLIAFGIRLLDQDRALAHQRRLELLDRAADQGVHVLEQDLAARAKRLLGAPCTLGELPDDAVCVVLHSDRIDAVPAQRIPYYPVAQALKEMPSEPFQELESNEFREPVHLDQALKMSRALAASSDPAVRAGALLREARILRKLGQTRDALAALGDLSTIASISIEREPADLLARRTRCAILEDQSRIDDLRTEASALAADLRRGKWHLDRETFLHVDEKLHGWLVAQYEVHSDGEDRLADAVRWLYEKWSIGPRGATAAGVQTLEPEWCGRHDRVVVWQWTRYGIHRGASISGSALGGTASRSRSSGRSVLGWRRRGARRCAEDPADCGGHGPAVDDHRREPGRTTGARGIRRTPPQSRSRPCGARDSDRHGRLLHLARGES